MEKKSIKIELRSSRACHATDAFSLIAGREENPNHHLQQLPPFLVECLKHQQNSRGQNESTHDARAGFGGGTREYIKC